MRESRLPSSIGFEPEAGSVTPSFTSMALARRMSSQTLSRAMSMESSGVGSGFQFPGTLRSSRDWMGVEFREETPEGARRFAQGHAAIGRRLIRAPFGLPPKPAPLEP